MPEPYFERFVGQLDERMALIIDPMLATGGSLIATIDMLKRKGCQHIKALVLVAAPEGIKALEAAHPDVQLYTAAIDSHLKGGRMKALAVTSDKRSSQLPQVPTVAESGVKGFEANTWFGFMAPAATPATVLTTLNTAINQALQSPTVRSRLMGEGGEVLGGSPAEFAALLKTDLLRWGRIVHEADARID
jgi:hypothetical protein